MNKLEIEFINLMNKYSSLTDLDEIYKKIFPNDDEDDKAPYINYLVYHALLINGNVSTYRNYLDWMKKKATRLCNDFHYDETDKIHPVFSFTRKQLSIIGL